MTSRESGITRDPSPQVRIAVTVDGRPVSVPPGSTVLDAVRQAGVDVPTLCSHPDLLIRGSCRLCVVSVDGKPGLVASCETPVHDGMTVRTFGADIQEARRVSLELLLARHPMECPICERSGHCELQAVAQRLGVRAARFTPMLLPAVADRTSPSIVREPARCILCRRCVEVCMDVQSVAALFPAGRGYQTHIGTFMESGLAQVACALCGQCLLACPTGAIHEVDHTERVWQAIADPERHVVVQTAPAIRVSLAEAFGAAPGEITTGKMVAALRRLGFDEVFDTNFAADLTILEEGHEFIGRLLSPGQSPLPMITSCSPGWIKFIEHFYPQLLGHLSSCKSPHEMLGALVKTYYAEKREMDPARLSVVSVMPCTAKKFEAERPEMGRDGMRDVDAVLTTRELARMIREAGIDFASLPEEDFDEPLGLSTGAAALFGATGGVMEAALRTVYAVVTGKEAPPLEFAAVRGIDGLREAEIRINGQAVRVAVAHGLGNARVLLDQIAEGKSPYQFIEVMACPGGCIGGGGQPIPSTKEIRGRRIRAIHAVDESKALRRSHENPALQQLYREYLGEPGSERAHHLLHTHYTPRALWQPVEARAVVS
ncbi:NADH-dependent [FeFe] hydrogenase, group A6 [Carboxydochorda subterranea]|uniref:NADH-dependent [FeFe] hydrogenase, group A6 n=1 Tax=Carboxydichorda subterranea TaxID=3109565 RepID=A0ABZ1BZ27_9FIRM|nr:NADH-dependent [FeFe] hydrogenase, group A6 [Limnochorda sp. L945t]WRP17338.1 NADH-dependent [FeFe] hydrogenase, group A6 [Limnochorda sp. L945t]